MNYDKLIHYTELMQFDLGIYECLVDFFFITYFSLLAKGTVASF